MKKAGKKRVSFFRKLTGAIRLMPDFLIIGAQRCGTTSLYNYLIKHPYIAPALKKEVHFFDHNYGQGFTWYRAHFPYLLTKIVYRMKGRCFVTGEATPYYIFHPHAPRRIANAIPKAKLILLLRNPIDRAYSQYHHAVRRGFESLSFEDAIDKEQQRLFGEIEKMAENENLRSFNHQKYSYLSRGIYIEQIKVWVSLFAEEQLLILKSEELYSNSQTVLDRVFEFLNLPSLEVDTYKRYNSTSYIPMDTNMRKSLISFFREYNTKLYELLGIDFDWDS